MSERARQQLLWELSEADVEPRGTMPADDELRAYRAGRLDEPAARRIEWRLARSAAARARLVELSGARVAEPDERTRRVVLGEGSSRRAWRPAASWCAALLAAATLAGVVVLWEVVRPRPAEVGPFTVQVEALAETRSAADSTDTLPETVVRVVLEPASDGPALDLHYGLYRLDAQRLIRVVASEGPARDGAILTAPAAELVGTLPGTRAFVAAVARRGLPEVVELDRRDPVETLAVATRGRAWSRSLTVLEPESPGGAAW